jgi:hypothetical protein
MTASPTCPHGITLDDLCDHAHKPTRQNPRGGTCTHGTSLNLLCRKLHGGELR